jgi:hypothetical protein
VGWPSVSGSRDTSTTIEKRRGYTQEDAKRILEAARKENEAHLRGGAVDRGFTGAPLGEICGAHVADVYEFGGVWCLDIRLYNRGENGSLKTEGSDPWVSYGEADVNNLPFERKTSSDFYRP